MAGGACQRAKCYNGRRTKLIYKGRSGPKKFNIHNLSLPENAVIAVLAQCLEIIAAAHFVTARTQFAIAFRCERIPIANQPTYSLHLSLTHPKSRSHKLSRLLCECHTFSAIKILYRVNSQKP